VTDNPEFDGRGVIVGILDTGVDPGAVGLTVTSEGKPKVVNIIDCTGSGDVAMGALQKVKENGTVDGALGYPLKINPAWRCPTGEFRVGYKVLYELYPSKALERRMRKDHKKDWTKEHQQHEQKVLSQTGASAKEGDEEDTKALLEALKGFEKDGDSDVGPLLDCLVFHDGERWQAVVDASESGDLSAVAPMSDFKHLRQYRPFSAEDAFNFSVNMYDNGDILSINVDSGAHGTHVAGIVAAYHPDDPQVNGVAPGAQIVSLKIGDTRLGSMETGVGIVRALIEAVRCGCHVINMSFGEAAAWDNAGAIVRLAEQVVGKHRVCFVGSAGNNGPAISTVGAPCGTSSAIMSIGAFAARSLMKPGYAMSEDTDETNYTWSSVGPTLDGHLGVSVMAPGGAVTCVPNWTLNKNQLMNGTSMSAPNATGCVALLLSASFASGIRPHPSLVRTAIENSAKWIDGVHALGQGHGLLQVPPAWELLKRRAADTHADVSFSVGLGSERFDRGIYLRQLEESSHKNTYNAQVTPVFPEGTESAAKIDFEKRFVVRATEDWVTCPPYVEMVQAGKSLPITVDCRGLPKGAVSTAMVRGYEEGASDWSFEIPVTVARPISVAAGTTKAHLPLDGPIAEEMLLAPGERRRTFLVPPVGCTFMEAIVTDNRRNGSALPAESEGLESDSRLIVCHALQTVRGVPYRDNEKECYFRVTPGSEHSMVWPVLAGVTMEFTLARYWSTLSQPNVTVRFNFKGLLPSPTALVIMGGARVSGQLRVRSLLGNADTNPSAKLDKWISTVKPSAPGKVSSLGERDVLPDATPLYQLVLEYSFECTGSTKITPRFPALQGILYESAFHAQMWFVYDSNKKLVGTGDSWPDEKELVGGKFTARMQVRHASAPTLQTLSDMPMLLERSVKAITLTAFKTQSDAAEEASKCGKRGIMDGGSVGYFFREPAQDSLPKGVSAGDVLKGSFTLEAKKTTAAGDGVRPGPGYALLYTVADTKMPAPKKDTPKPTPAKKTGDKEVKGEEGEEKNKEEDKGEKKKTPTEALNEAVRDAEVKHLKSLCGDSDAFNEVSGGLAAKYPTHLPLLLVFLQHAVKCCKKKREGKDATDADRKAGVDGVVSAADAVVASLDTTSMATALGTNVDSDDTAAVAARKEVDTQKSGLEEALSCKAAALLEHAAGDTAAGDAAFEDVLKELARWTSLSGEKLWKLQVARHRARGKLGLALARVGNLLKGSADNKDKEGVVREDLLAARDSVLAELGWTHIAAQEKRKAVICKHASYAAF